jgi:hypothetical protein
MAERSDLCGHPFLHGTDVGNNDGVPSLEVELTYSGLEAVVD